MNQPSTSTQPMNTSVVALTNSPGDDANSVSSDKKVDLVSFGNKMANKTVSGMNDLPNWSNEEINFRLQESAKMLQEWNELMNKTGKVNVLFVFKLSSSSIYLNFTDKLKHEEVTTTDLHRHLSLVCRYIYCADFCHNYIVVETQASRKSWNDGENCPTSGSECAIFQHKFFLTVFSLDKTRQNKFYNNRFNHPKSNYHDE